VTKLDDVFLRGRVVVVSAHLDDAALSVGATIARVASTGAEVSVLTVLAGDPESNAPAGQWDRACGFESEGEAARKRRLEDSRGCELVGAKPVWLPFPDEQYERSASDDEVWAAVEHEFAGAALVLVPGYPLCHPDHLWLTKLVLSRLDSSTCAGLYVEEFYTSDLAIGHSNSLKTLLKAGRVAVHTRLGCRIQAPPVAQTITQLAGRAPEWIAVRPNRRERRLKRAFTGAYPSQLDVLGDRLTRRIWLYERAAGGELVGLLRSAE
jgi:LmbE family N-acetylglucosaminyl deacetylase